jgi:predicted GIY-YIG superfamily endonuclease
MSNRKHTEGFVYIISNSNFPTYYKVGVTQNINKRLKSYQTSSPYRNYKIEYYIFHSDCYKAEKQIEESMKHFCTDKKNEWYKIPLHMAISRLDEQLENN